MCSSTFSTARMSMSGPCCVPSSSPLPTLSPLTASAIFAANASWIPSWTSNRLAHTQVCPALRYFEAIAPATAASRSASSKTMKGALPPSSRLTFFTVEAHCDIRSLPTSVEPVNESLRTVGFEVSSAPIGPDGPGDDVDHAGRDPRPFGERREGQGGERGLRRRADDHGAAGGEGRGAFAGDHRGGEVPRGDRGDDADRLLQHHDPFAWKRVVDDVAVHPLPLLREPFDEGRRVGDLAARLGQRLALLAGHQHCEIFLMRHHEVEPAAHQVGALLGRA